jgi:hypothetical protein
MLGVRFVLFSLAALVVTSVIPIATLQFFHDPASLHAWAVVTFVADLVAVSGIVLGLGFAVTGRVWGIALSSYNDFSLSKLQMALWTIVVLSALLTTARLNLLGYFGPMPPPAPIVDATSGQVATAPEASDVPAGPLDIDIPGELLAAMGIAAFSTVAVPSILALKAGQAASPRQKASAAQRVADATGNGAGATMHVGCVTGYADSDCASWLDIVTGDEVANAGTVDMSKVQQLLVTLLLLGTYCFLLIRGFATSPAHGMLGLPPLSARFIELLAISHAGYLAYKAAPKAGQNGRDTDGTGGGGAAGDAGTDGIPVRLSIVDAGMLTGLSVTLDGKPVAVGASGFVEIPLSPGLAHVFAARATRAGAAVSGTLTQTVGMDDIDAPLAITLS